MVSIQPYSSGGNKYYRIVESKRIDGNPTPIVVEHLGNADTLLKRLRGEDEGTSVNSWHHGAVAGLKHTANTLNVEALITDHAEPTRRGQDVGTTILLAAINRAIAPTSKRGWAEWAAGTSLKRFYPTLTTGQLTSQYFWDQMNALPQPALEHIENELTKRVVETLDLDLETLFYDTTNWYTFIATNTDRTALAQRGRNKQHRHDLRQVGLSLLVHKDSQIPLASQLYPGNHNDKTQFPRGLTQVRERVTSILGSLEDVTLVYDQGNNSKTNQDTVDASELHYVAAVSPKDHPDLTDPPPEAGTELTGRYEGWPARRFRAAFWGTERTFVCFRSPSLQHKQTRNLERSLEQALGELCEWRETLASPQAGSHSARTAQNRIDRILRADHLSEIVEVAYDFAASGSERLDWTVDADALEEIAREVFGLRVVMTDQQGWTTQEILDAYHGQSEAEHAFRSLKDVDHFRIRPQFHWTDQKLRVHAFICLLSYTLARTLHHRARNAGWAYSLSRLLDLLDRVRLAVVVREYGGGKPQARFVLEREPQEGLDLLRDLVPDEAPFVYTTRIV